MNYSKKFEDLKLLDELEIKSIPLKILTKNCLKSLQKNEKDLEMFKFIFEKVAFIFDPDEFETEVLLYFGPEIRGFIDRINHDLSINIGPTAGVENMEILIKLGEIFVSFLKYLMEVSNLYQVYSAIGPTTYYLEMSYIIISKKIKHSKSAEDTEILECTKTFIGIAKKVQCALVVLLTKGQYFTNLELVNEYEAFKELLASLCLMAESIRSICDTRLAIEIWTIIKKMSLKNENFIKKEDNQWLETAVRILCQEATKATSNEKEIKLKLFYVELLLNFSSTFIKGGRFTGHKHLVTAMISLGNLSSQINVGFMAILGSIYTDPKFIETFLLQDLYLAKDISVFISYLTEIIAKLVQSNDENILDVYLKKFDILGTVEKLLSRGHILWVTKPKFYIDLLTYTILFIVFAVKFKNRLRQKIVEERIVKMILQEDFWVGVFGIELLFAFIRVNSQDLIIIYLDFFAKINENLSTVPRLNSNVFVKIVIQRLHQFLSSEKRKIVEQQFLPVEDNLKLWSVIGAKSLKDDLKAKIIEETMSKIDDLSKNEQKFETFYEVLLNLKIISSYNSKFDRFFMNSIENLWNVVENISNHSIILDNFVSILLIVTPDQVILAKFPILYKFYDKLDGFLKLSILKCLEKLEMFEVMIDERYLKIFAKLMNDSDKLIKVKALQAFQNCLDQNRELVQRIFIEISKIRPDLKSEIISYFRITEKISDDEFYMFLSNQNTVFTQEHICNPAIIENIDQNVTNVTLEINARIDDMFPDESDDDEQIFLDCVSPKRIKMDVDQALDVMLEKAKLIEKQNLDENQRLKLECLKSVINNL